MGAVMKYLAGVTTLAYDPSLCNGCGRCVEVCPHGVFVMHEKRAAIVDRDGCMECGACQRNCDARALTVSTGVGCAAAIIGGLVSGSEPSCGCDDAGCC